MKITNFINIFDFPSLEKPKIIIVDHYSMRFCMNILWFDELSMDEVKKAALENKVVIIPCGSIEEHGKHLPICTDSIQAEFIALEVAKKINCLVAPPLRYGLCNSTKNFPGTISISFDSLRNIMRDILEEFIRNGFNKLFILTGHAGGTHTTALRIAAKEIIIKHSKKKNKPRIIVCSDYDFAFDANIEGIHPEDSHAGTIETSRVMSIRPDLIKGKGIKNFPNIPKFEIISDPEKYFPSGVMGDPTISSNLIGHKINKHIIDKIVKLVKELME